MVNRLPMRLRSAALALLASSVGLSLLFPMGAFSQTARTAAENAAAVTEGAAGEVPPPGEKPAEDETRAPEKAGEADAPRPERPEATEPEKDPAAQAISEKTEPAEKTEDFPAPEAARADDLRFLSGRNAYRQRDLKRLSEVEKALSASGYELSPYLTLWRLNLELRARPEDPAVHQAFRRLIETHRGSYVSERAAVEYLQGTRGKLPRKDFEALEAALLWNRDDPAIRSWLALYDLGEKPSDKALENAKILYRDTASAAQSSQALGDRIGALDPAWTWERVIVLVERGQWREAKRAVTLLPPKERPAPVKTLQHIIDNPRSWFAQHKKKLEQVPARLAVLAALRLARISQDDAALLAATFQARRILPFWQSLVWSEIARFAASSLHPKALEWFDLAGRACDERPHVVVNREGLHVWEARAAVLAADWKRVLSSIARMPPAVQKEEAWVYWKARALSAQGQAEPAQKGWASLASSVSYYGKLACDALGESGYGFEKNAEVSPEEAEALWRDNPNLLRARAFYRAGLTYEGNREWNWAMRGLEGKDYIVLADYARQLGLVHRMINTSDRSGTEAVSIVQRFPMPYCHWVEKSAGEQKLPQSWIYGIMRQESRFIPTIRSSAGALGLMQVMPATGRWTAKKIGMTGFRAASLSEPPVNIALGTTYLRLLFEDLDASPVLATIAYNAGPARARAWRARLPNTLESARFIENIPFSETREYVKNVLANRHTYEMREGKTPQRFTELLGEIVPSTQVNHPDLP